MCKLKTVLFAFEFLLLAITGSAQTTFRVAFATYLGGAGAQETINDIKVDAAGNAYVTYDLYDDTGPAHRFAVSKISPAGGSGYTTVLGHFHSDESATALVIDAAGNAYVTGWAQSYPSGHPRFLTVNALQPEPAGGVDAVVVKLDPQGQVVFATYLGGSGNDYGRDIALDSAGNIYITGTTSSNDFPIRNPIQPLRTPGGASGADVFVTKLNPSGSAILYSTYLGGGDDDSVASIALDAAGDIYLAGSTRSASFAGRTNIQTPNWAGYAVKLNPAGSALAYSFLWTDPRQDHIVRHAALDGSGNLYIAESGVVRKLNAFGNAFTYSRTTLPGISGVAVDSRGNAYASGGGVSGLYVAKIPPDGASIAFDASLNGTIRLPGDPTPTSSVGNAIAVTASGAVYIGGYSESLNFPTTNGSTRSGWTAASKQDAILLVMQPE